MKDQPIGKKGEFIRPTTQFRNWISNSPDSRFSPEAGRYHLYVSYACPWAHRTLITRQLMGLTDCISVSVVDPLLTVKGWHFSTFPGATQDTVNGKQFLAEIYELAKPGYDGRITVPVLWDTVEKTIVNNESREIIRMFSTQFKALAATAIDLCPADRKDDIDAVLDRIYSPINNGVYRTGFATTQAAYDEAVAQLFEALDEWDAHFGDHDYAVGDQISEADICLFTTLFRFDPVYVTHFKCNIRRIMDYQNLWAFLKRMYALPGVAETCQLDHIKNHYFQSHRQINPYGIVPAGPAVEVPQ